MPLFGSCTCWHLHCDHALNITAGLHHVELLAAGRDEVHHEACVVPKGVIRNYTSVSNAHMLGWEVAGIRYSIGLELARAIVWTCLPEHPREALRVNHEPEPSRGLVRLGTL